MRGDNWYINIGKVFGMVLVPVTFVGVWIAAVKLVGWVFGITLGWIPALLVAFLVGFLVVVLWGPVVLLGFAAYQAILAGKWTPPNEVMQLIDRLSG